MTRTYPLQSRNLSPVELVILGRVASTQTVTAGEPLRALAEHLRTPLFELDGALGALSPVAQNTLQGEATKLAEVSSAQAPMSKGATGTSIDLAKNT